ncbi:MAG: hypothetical protein GF411_02655 [Candidatus Lokiarchaeota archaeon]|nr:hypothetical protein [Candidatus Lokiarchaeota archaeon]
MKQFYHKYELKDNGGVNVEIGNDEEMVVRDNHIFYGRSLNQYEAITTEEARDIIIKHGSILDISNFPEEFKKLLRETPKSRPMNLLGIVFKNERITLEILRKAINNLLECGASKETIEYILDREIRNILSEETIKINIKIAYLFWPETDKSVNDMVQIDGPTMLVVFSFDSQNEWIMTEVMFLDQEDNDKGYKKYDILQ